MLSGENASGQRGLVFGAPNLAWRSPGLTFQSSALSGLPVASSAPSLVKARSLGAAGSDGSTYMPAGPKTRAGSDVAVTAAGLQRDLDTVTAGLTLPYSSGPVEGHVNRIILWNLSPVHLLA